MDQFVKHIFPEFNAPGAVFQLSSAGEVFTFYRGLLSVEWADSGVANRVYRAVQAMTPAGLMSAKLIGHVSMLDGISKQYLTPEGGLNMSTLEDAVKASCGMQTSVQMGNLLKWEWSDNQVTLLVNMLRFALMRKFSMYNEECLDLILPCYNDGKVRVSRNSYFPDADYPERGEWEWPGGVEAANYSMVTRLTDTHPVSDDSVLDLRTLTQGEAQFVLLMLAAWRRRSRYRLDFATPKLCNRVMYRADVRSKI